ncbi:hypothetical protein V1264_008912 [Littorina saxatilis]|uniref:Uncharacterized protein n=1 Tax=Littorina saxatilis TaxID=31220 RepID=A0AAN9AQK0_9CAEN
MRSKHATCLLTLSFSMELLLAVQNTAAVVYRKEDGMKLETCTQSLLGVSSLTKCVALCSLSSQCVSGSHVPATGQCCLSDRYIYQPGVESAVEEDAIYFQQEQDFATDEQWAMVVNAKSGNRERISNSFLETGTYHDYPLGGALAPVTCWTASASGHCDKHVRSKLMEQWNGGWISPKKVKFALYEDNTEVVSIVFNGAGSTPTTWFEPARIVSSTYQDIGPNETYAFFGFYGNAVGRFFNVCKYAVGSCSTDEGWLAVVEKGYCDFESGVKPLLRYSRLNTSSRWDTEAPGYAKVMIVYVEI